MDGARALLVEDDALYVGNVWPALLELRTR
jgi:hypothetical protein